MNWRRIRTIAGIAMIGEGVVVALRPRRYVRLWNGGPRWWRRFVRAWMRRPGMTRTIGIAELLAGIWMVLRGTDE
jgi:hypothetical protein